MIFDHFRVPQVRLDSMISNTIFPKKNAPAISKVPLPESLSVFLPFVKPFVFVLSYVIELHTVYVAHYTFSCIDMTTAKNILVILQIVYCTRTIKFHGLLRISLYARFNDSSRPSVKTNSLEPV